MLILKEITTHSHQYADAEKLLTEAFPPEERRDIATQRYVTDNNKKFQAFAIIYNFDFAGLINIWHLNGIVYIEHLAILPELRQQGIASETLKHIKNHGRPIILEVEPATNTDSCKRIKFYEKNGFILRPIDYTQPAYAPNLPEIKMHIMTCGNIADINEIINAIKTNVYNKGIEI